MNTDINSMELCEKLWNEYEPELRKLCHYRLSSYPSEIDDVIAEVYLALCNAINKGEDISKPKAWLYGTVNNLIKLKYTELNKIKRLHINLDSVEHELFYDLNIDESLLTAEVIEALKDEIFDELTATDKTLLILIYIKKLKFRDIAKILNTTESAVKQRHYRLKRKVKSLAKEKIKKFY